MNLAVQGIGTFFCSYSVPEVIVKQMADAEGVTEDLKRCSQWDWIRATNNIASRAEEIIRSELINA